MSDTLNEYDLMELAEMKLEYFMEEVLQGSSDRELRVTLFRPHDPESRATGYAPVVTEVVRDEKGKILNLIPIAELLIGSIQDVYTRYEPPDPEMPPMSFDLIVTDKDSVQCRKNSEPSPQSFSISSSKSLN